MDVPVWPQWLHGEFAQKDEYVEPVDMLIDGQYRSQDDVETLHDDVGHKPPFHLLEEFGEGLVDMSQETRDDKEDRRSIEQKELLEPGVGLAQINQVYHDDVQDEHTLQKV